MAALQLLNFILILIYHFAYADVYLWGSMTFTFETATWPFLKIDMRHIAYSYRRIQVNDVT